MSMKIHSSVNIGSEVVGEGQHCCIVAEIGINHNGDLNIAQRLIDVAADAGCNAVKFQKRSVDLVYSPEELAKPCESPFGAAVGDIKRGREFNEEQYERIAEHCKRREILWFASCWDPDSVDFINRFDPPCFKIASACLTNDDLLRKHRKTGKPIILSTGMSSLAQIDHAVDVLGREDLILLHATSVYPAKPEQLNLRAMRTLRSKYGVPVGYSGHEVGLQTTIAAAALGACMVERHITLDRAMWGADHAASVEPEGVRRLVRDIRVVEAAMGDGQKVVYDEEIPNIERLRRVG